VLITDPLADPEDHVGAQAGSVDQQLAQVIVVGLTELVLDQNDDITRVSHDVRAEVADRLLHRIGIEVDPQGITEEREILGPGEPRREVRRLARKGRPDRHGLEVTERGRRVMAGCHGQRIDPHRPVRSSFSGR
jgi:hypothetical protein